LSLKRLSSASPQGPAILLWCLLILELNGGHGFRQGTSALP
jgi:hypothetical protein